MAQDLEDSTSHNIGMDMKPSDDNVLHLLIVGTGEYCERYFTDLQIADNRASIFRKLSELAFNEDAFGFQNVEKFHVRYWTCDMNMGAPPNTGICQRIVAENAACLAYLAQKDGSRNRISKATFEGHFCGEFQSCVLGVSGREREAQQIQATFSSANIKDLMQNKRFGFDVVWFLGCTFPEGVVEKDPAYIKAFRQVLSPRGLVLYSDGWGQISNNLPGLRSTYATAAICKSNGKWWQAQEDLPDRGQPCSHLTASSPPGRGFGPRPHG